MTIYELALARIIDCGMTEEQAEKFLLQFGGREGKQIPWGDISPFLSRAVCDQIDFAAGRWLNNAANAAMPAPCTVREFRDGKKLAAGDDDSFPPRAA